MPRDASPPGPDPERRRSAGSDRPRAVAAPEARRGNGTGSSGYGMDSIRHNLRHQLDQRHLLRPGPPPGDDDGTPGGGKRRGSG